MPPKNKSEILKSARCTSRDYTQIITPCFKLEINSTLHALGRSVYIDSKV